MPRILSKVPMEQIVCHQTEPPVRIVGTNDCFHRVLVRKSKPKGKPQGELPVIRAKQKTLPPNGLAWIDEAASRIRSYEHCPGATHVSAAFPVRGERPKRTAETPSLFTVFIVQSVFRN